MDIVKINEPIRVLASCAPGAIAPVRFKWQQRTYNVERINGQWRERHEDGDAWHFSVQTGPTTYFMHFSSRDLQWWLDELISEG